MATGEPAFRAAPGTGAVHGIARNASQKSRRGSGESGAHAEATCSRQDDEREYQSLECGGHGICGEPGVLMATGHRRHAVSYRTPGAAVGGEDHPRHLRGGHVATVGHVPRPRPG